MLNNFIVYAAEGAKTTNVSSLVITFALWIGVFYFILIRPNRKKQKKHAEMMETLKTGTEIITSGGIKGEVVSVTEDFVVIKVDKGVNLTVKKSSIGTVHNK